MKNIKQFPVGSVCIVVRVDTAKEMLGKEVTITGPLEECYYDDPEKYWLGYATDTVLSDGLPFTPPHEYLKLKEPPKPSAEDEAFRSFMDRVMKPVEIRDEEVVK